MAAGLDNLSPEDFPFTAEAFEAGLQLLRRKRSDEARAAERKKARLWVRGKKETGKGKETGMDGFDSWIGCPC